MRRIYTTHVPALKKKLFLICVLTFTFIKSSNISLTRTGHQLLRPNRLMIQSGKLCTRTSPLEHKVLQEQTCICVRSPQFDPFLAVGWYQFPALSLTTTPFYINGNSRPGLWGCQGDGNFYWAAYNFLRVAYNFLQQGWHGLSCSKRSVQPWRRSSNKANCVFSIIVHPNMLCVCHPYKPRSLVLRIDQALHSAVFGTHTLEQPLPVLGTLTPLLDFRTHTLGTPTSGSLEPILGTPTLVLQLEPIPFSDTSSRGKEWPHHLATTYKGKLQQHFTFITKI